MRTIGHFSPAMRIGAILIGVLAIALGASRLQTPTKPHDLSHFVKFEQGGTQLRDGDQITIEEIHGTSSTIDVGQLYEIKGTYKLASHERAQLAVEITSSDPTHYSHMQTQEMIVDQGEGRFTVYMYMWCKGNPHMSFYPTTRGESFASVYFGTGESVLRHAGWLDDPK